MSGVGRDPEYLYAFPVAKPLRVLNGESLETGQLSRLGTDQRGDRPLVGDVLDLDLAADRVHGQVAKDRGAGGCFDIEPELVFVQQQDSHVALDVTLALEEGGVAAGPRFQRLDVVGDLALQVLGGIGATDDQLAARGAVEHPSAFTQDPVLGVDLGQQGGSHPYSLSLG
jgi:hypothetical protein